MRGTLLDDSKQRNKKLLKKLQNKKKSKKVVSKDTLRYQLDKLHSKVDEHFPNPDKYRIVMDQQELYKYLEKDEIISLDTESDTVKSEPDPILDTFVGFSSYTKNSEQAIYVPIQHKKTHLITHNYNHDYDKQLTCEDIAEVFREIGGKKFVFHTARYDTRVFLRNLGYFDLDSVYWDVFIASKYLNENESHGLKYLYDRYVAREESESLETTKSLGFTELFEDIDFSLVPLDLAYLYAGKDAVMTLDLFDFQYDFLHPEGEYTESKGLKDAGNYFINWEMPLVKPVTKMIEKGIKFDNEYADELKEKYSKKLNKVEKDIHDFLQKLDFNKLPKNKRDSLGEPVNLRSSKQMSIILYDVLKLRYDSRTTDEECLEYFASSSFEVGKDIHKNVNLPVTTDEMQNFFKNMLKHRTISKLISTYIDAMPEMVMEDGRIHTILKQMGTVTGRFSSSNPNLQNIPKSNKDIRRMFKADPGKVLICSDYSQQEPRVLAYISGDEKMIKAYEEGKDLYSIIASMIFDVPYRTCLKGQKNQPYRTICKAIVLGVMYGRSVGSVAEQLEMSYKKVNEILEEFKSKFSGVKTAIEGATEFCREQGFVKTIHGRKRRLPDINLQSYVVKADNEQLEREYLRKLNNAGYKETARLKKQAKAEGVYVKDNTAFISKAERQSINSIIQGSSADMTKKAIVMIDKDEQLQDLGYELLLTVHDEVIGQIDKDWGKIKKATERIGQLMREAGEPVTVPMSVDHDIQIRWNGIELEKEV